MKRSARIIGTGSYLPSKVLTNQDLEKMVETSDEWITTRTGIKERRIAAPNEFTSDMAKEAALRALKNAGVGAESLDLIIVGTITPDFVFPSTACLLQASLNAENAAAIDIQAACSGMIYALSIAKAYIESGIYRNILVIASEKLSSIVDYEDRTTCVLFGDGAAACLVSSEGKGLLIREVSLGADGSQEDLLKLPAGGSHQPATIESVGKKQHFIKMSGSQTFKHAVRRMEAAAKACLESQNLTEADLKWLIAHQANDRIIDAMAKRFLIPMERVYKTIHKYGNTSASSVGIVLDELKSKNVIEPSDFLLLVAFGGGLTWGAALLEEES
ncbi:MAG: beta-ketoacyl-ACP synthase III [Simkaniaceae bacterium]